MNVYTESTLLEKVTKTKKIAFLDIDLTMTGEPEIQIDARKKLEDLGYAVIFVTSRPYELMLSDEALSRSPTLTRLPAKVAKDTQGKRYHVNLKNLPKYYGLLDADAMADTTGIRVVVLQQDGEYLIDSSLYNFEWTSAEWKANTMDILKQIAKITAFTIKECEYLKNYEKNTIEISPPDYRIQLDFLSLEAKERFIGILKSYEESHHIFPLDDSEFERSNYSIYIFPFPTTNVKGTATDHIIKKICQNANIKKTELQILIAGDSYPDLMMILESGKETHGLFYLAGGSRLSSCFIDKHKMNYLHIDISSWKMKLKKIKKGIYAYNDRIIYVGEELFTGKLGAESIRAFLQSSYVKQI